MASRKEGKRHKKYLEERAARLGVSYEELKMDLWMIERGHPSRLGLVQNGMHLKELDSKRSEPVRGTLTAKPTAEPSPSRRPLRRNLHQLRLD